MPSSKRPPPTSPIERRRPRGGDAQLTVEAILDAVLLVARAEGRSAVTTTRVAARAGVGVGTLYQYFVDRDALLRAAEERAYAGLAARVAARMEELVDVPSDEAAFAIVREVVGFLGEGAGVLGFTPEDERVTAERVELVERLADAALGFIGPARPLPRAEDPRLAMVLAMKTTLALAWLGIRDHADAMADGRMATEIARVVTRYLFPGTAI